MNKVELFRLLLFAALVCLLLWATDPLHRLPAGLKQLLITGTLLWFMLLLSGKNRDDYWAHVIYSGSVILCRVEIQSKPYNGLAYPVKNFR